MNIFTPVEQFVLAQMHVSHTHPDRFDIVDHYDWLDLLTIDRDLPVEVGTTELLILRGYPLHELKPVPEDHAIWDDIPF